MSAVIGKDNIKIESPINWNFEIDNGLLGIKRDSFLLLLAYMNFGNGEKKTRNV
jgi:hypothetical protein